MPLGDIEVIWPSKKLEVEILNDILKRCKGNIATTGQKFSLLSEYQKNIYKDFWDDIRVF